MSEIDVIGKRLVKESQDRRDQIRRRQERYEKKTAIASLVLPLGAKIIEDGLIRKSQDFFNQENVLNLTREYNKAATNAAGVISTEQKIQASGVDTQTYFADINFEAAKTQLTDLLTEEQKGGREMLNAAEIEMRARTIAEDQATLQAKEHNEALAIAVNLGTREEFHAERDRILKPTTPTTITGWLGRGVTTALGGDSTQERQATAIADFKRGGQFETLGHLNTAVDEFKATNSWRSAFSKAAEDSTQPEVTQYWRDKVADIKGMKDYETEEWTYSFTTTTNSNGEQVVAGLRFKSDSFGNMDPNTREIVEPLVLSTDPDMAARYKMQYTNGLRASFDPRRDTQGFLTSQGYEKWQAKIRENKREDGSSISLEDWGGQEEWDIVVDSWQEFMDENRNDFSIMREDKLTQAEAILLEVQLKSEYIDDLKAAMIRHKTMTLKTNNPEEYTEAKEYYKALEIDPDQTKIEMPTNYGDYKVAIEAEREHEDAINIILDSVRNRGIVIPELEEANNQEGREEINIDIGALVRDETRSGLSLDWLGEDGSIITPTQIAVSTGEDEEDEPVLDWPDDLKQFRADLDAAQRAQRYAKETDPAAAMMNVSINRALKVATDNVENYERDKKQQIQGYKNRLVAKDNQADRDELTKLEEELEQFLAMQDSDSASERLLASVDTEDSEVQTTETSEQTTPTPTEGEDMTPSGLDITLAEEDIFENDTLASTYIKGKEGYSETPYWDVNHWTWGYGTEAPLPKDRNAEVPTDLNITREKANEELHGYLDREIINKLNDYSERHNYNWSNTQKEGLTSFLYNLGYGKIHQLTDNGTRTNEEIAEAMLLYHNVDDGSGKLVPSEGLIRRREEEYTIFVGGG